MGLSDEVNTAQMEAQLAILKRIAVLAEQVTGTGQAQQLLSLAEARAWCARSDQSHGGGATIQQRS